MKDDKGRFIGFISPRYTQVPDELFDELLPDLSGAELKVLMYVVRKTFGWKKTSDQISISQMERGVRRVSDGRVLDRGTGLSRGAIVKAVRALVEKNILIKLPKTSPDRGYMATEYSLNVLDHEFQGRAGGPPPSRKSGLGGGGASAKRSQAHPTPSIQIEQGPGAENGQGLVGIPSSTPVAKIDPQKTKEQERIQQHPRVVASSENGLVSELVKRGVTRATALYLVRRHQDRIPAKLEVFDFLVRSRSPQIDQNPPGFLRRSIEEDYAPPASFLSEKQDSERRQSRQAAKESVERLKREYQEHLRARMAEWQSSLDNESRDRLRNRAKEVVDEKVRGFPGKLPDGVVEEMIESEYLQIARNEMSIPPFELWAESAPDKDATGDPDPIASR